MSRLRHLEWNQCSHGHHWNLVIINAFGQSVEFWVSKRVGSGASGWIFEARVLYHGFYLVFYLGWAEVLVKRWHWCPFMLDLHRFMVAVARVTVGHDGRSGTAPDPLVWDQGGKPTARKLASGLMWTLPLFPALLISQVVPLIPSVPVSEGLVIRHGCQFLSSLVRALAKLLVVLTGFRLVGLALICPG